MDYIPVICPQCGGELQVNKNMETAYCMHCGTKLIVPNLVKSVQINNLHKLTQWYKLAEEAAAGGNRSEAYEFYTKILEEKDDEWKAYFGKGTAAGWQSTIAKPRIFEAANQFIKAFEYAPIEEQDAVGLSCVLGLRMMIDAHISLRGDLLKIRFDVETTEDINEDVNLYGKAIGLLRSAGIETGDHFLGIGEGILTEIKKAYHDLHYTYESDHNYHPDEYSFTQYLKSSFSIEEAIENLKVEYKEEDQFCIECINTLIEIKEDNNKSKAYRLIAGADLFFKDEYAQTKEFHPTNQKMNREKIRQLKKESIVLEGTIKNKQKKVIDARRDLYWKQHAEEKKEIEQELANLNEKLLKAEINKEEFRIAQEPEIEILVKEIAETKKGIWKGGIFNSGERMKKKQIITTKEEQLNGIREELKRVMKDYNKEIGILEGKILEIEGELRRDR